MDRDSRDKLIEQAKEFVLARGDGTPDEMNLYADIATGFAAEQVRAERERIAKQLEEFVWKHNNDERHIGVEPCQVCQICDELCAIYTTLRGEG